MPDVPEHLVKLPTYSRRFHGLGKFHILHELSNWYYTWASLIRECDGNVTQTLEDADYIVIDPQRIDRNDPSRSLPNISRKFVYISDDWVHKQAHDSTSHPLEEGIIDPYNIPSRSSRAITQPASSPAVSHKPPRPIRAPSGQRHRWREEMKKLASSPTEAKHGEMVHTTSPASIKAYQPRAKATQDSALSTSSSAAKSAMTQVSAASDYEELSSSATAGRAHSPDPTGTSSQLGAAYLSSSPSPPSGELPDGPSGSAPALVASPQCSPQSSKRARAIDAAESDLPAKSSKHAPQSSTKWPLRRFPLSTPKLSNICPWIVDKDFLDYAATGRLYPLEMIRLLPYAKISDLGVEPDLWHSGSTTISDAGTPDQRRQLFASVFAVKETYLMAWQTYWALAIEVLHEPSGYLSSAFMDRWAEIQAIESHSGWSVAVRFLHDHQELCADSNISISSPGWMDVARAFLARRRMEKVSVG